MANVRSEYLQSLIEDKNKLENTMKEVAESTINSIMGKNINETIRHILTEAEEDSFEEDEVEEVKPEDGSDETVIDSEEISNEETPEEVDGENITDVEADIETDQEEDVWNDLESLKGEDGEYDLTGMDKEGLIKVMRVMTPEDGVRVLKNDNGTITLSDDSTDKEYIIDIDCAEGDCEAEITTESKTNLGYGVHQNQTAMETPANPSDTTNKKQTHGLGTEPTGDGKRFGNGVGDGEPFDNNVSEETIIEVVQDDAVNETMTTQEQGPYARGTGMQHANTNSKPIKGRNSSEGGQKVKGTGEAPYSNAQLESIKRKANEIWKENKELKDVIIPALKRQIQENILINESMGYVVKLILNNSTTVNEKKDILKRFTEVKSKQEGDALFRTISEELKRAGKTLNINEVMNSQLSESTERSNEKPMYKSEELSNALDLIKRMNNI